MIDQQVDILIIGGGLIGASLMLALQDSGYSTLLVEQKQIDQQLNPDFDARSLAIAPASVAILEMLGVWRLLQKYATPIHRIHVSEQNRFGASRLYSEEDAPLGYVLEIQHLNHAVQQLVPQQHILTPATVCALDLHTQQATIVAGDKRFTIQAGLIVAADGVESSVRHLCHLSAQVKEYRQQAIVCNVGLNRAHEYQAFERFTPEGPLALLPMQHNRMSLIWSMSETRADAYMQVDDAFFLHALQRAFGYRLGRFTQIGKRFSYTMRQVVMDEQVAWPVVFVGNAAHTLHPVAGQGFNLGLRDVAALAQCIIQHGIDQSMLRYYLQLRQRDQKIVTSLTDGLIQLFTSRLPGVALARDLGLIVLDNAPLLKKILIRHAQGFGGVLPDLVCHIALERKGE